MKTSFLVFFSALALAVAGANGNAPKKIDMVAQKRVQYGRVLYPPQEKGFNPDAWIEKIESPDMTRGEFGLIEDLLDARSRLYAAAERLRCRPERDEKGEELAVKISVEIAGQIAPYVDGFYIMTPFGRAALVGRIMDGIRQAGLA